MTSWKKCLTPIAAVALIWFVTLASRAAAQTAPVALPTAPGADRAVNGGLSQAHASLPGGPGLSPLEPYLVLWLLPVSGLLTVAAAVYVDRRILALQRRHQ
jgi:hypothetical protein